MKITFLLHFYQPHNQQADILDRIVNESYRPLINGFLANPRAKVVVNINGALSQLLRDGKYYDVLEGLEELAKRGQIEYTGSGMYHAFLPLLPEEEILRQIEQNERTNSRLLGESYQPKGFFSPEMAINEKVLKTVSRLEYKWLPVPELAQSRDMPSPDRFYKHNKTDLRVFFRHKRVSTLVLSSVVRDATSLIKETQDLVATDKYWFCVMDAETFGHHRIGHEKVLLDILSHEFFEPILITELLAQKLPTEKVSLRDCTWTNTEQDFELKGSANSFVLWQDPQNPIHNLQWKFVDLVLKLLKNSRNKNSEQYQKARKLMDSAVSSDQFWWASVKPWWSLEMVESGAFDLKEVVRVLKGGSGKTGDDKKADKMYRAILDQAFAWQRSGVIRKKHLENSATFMKESFKKRAPSEWYNQIILEFTDEMNRAAQKREFEKAVKWRDAILKLDQGTDIYDVLHVVDELWSARQVPSVKPFLEHEWEELSEFAKQYLRDATSKDQFEEWKKRKKNQI